MNLDEEKRGDYLVSKETKKLWAVDLSILVELERVCTKYGLKYYADGGTLLGAVRNRGFIPWDDDIDIQMMSDDFNFLCSIAELEFKEPFFFQYYKSEEGCPPWHAKLRRSDTTGFTEYEKKYKPLWNHGIFIDIFPLYGIPDKEREFKWQCSRLKLLRKVMTGYEHWYAYITTGKKAFKPWEREMLLWRFCRCFISPETLFKQYLRICSEAGNETRRVGVTSFQPGDPNLIWDREMFSKIVQLPFEDRMIPCPIQYDARLRVQYGDYMVERKGTERHSSLIFDADIPYIEYEKNKMNNVGI